jgi:FKBP-type peptidyl-prolyl cis-trans isomerase FkpA/FKBP-type peptidyl-prolyl cis-trans isomerase FklB
MRKVLPFALVMLSWCWSTTSHAQQAVSEQDKTIYAIGVLLNRELAVFNLTPQELELVKAGMTDQALGKSLQADVQVYGPKIQEFQQARALAVATAERKAGADYALKAAKQSKTKKTASGLLITTLQSGKGASPKATDRVRVNYRGTLLDGTEFDSSFKRGTPATFALNQVIACWTEGVPLMKVGGKSRLVCPDTIAYGDRGSPPLVKPGATLIFEIELLGIEK